MKPFYLYRIFYGDVTLYVGKGSGQRLQHQKRSFTAQGEIVAQFADENAAYRAEMALIKKLDPPLNRHVGGLGGRFGQRVAIPNGLSPEGLRHAAPHLARLVSRMREFPDLLHILRAYLEAHGLEALTEAVVPHLRAMRSTP